MFNIITSTATIVSPQITTALNSFISVGFESLLLLATAGLTYGIKMGLGLIHNSLVRAFAQRAVSYAENRMIGNDEKRKVVAAKIHEKFPRLSEDEINHFLEEAVVNLQAGNSATSPS